MVAFYVLIALKLFYANALSGAKSEVVVTSAGVNLHPEDLETATEPKTVCSSLCRWSIDKFFAEVAEVRNEST